MSASRAAALAVALALVPPGARAAPSAHRHHVIGVLAHRPKPEARAGWVPVVEALARATPACTFELEVLDYGELEEALRLDRLDVVVTDPGHYIQIRERIVTTGLIATVVAQAPGRPLSSFGGTIFALREREDLTGLDGLRRARIAAVGTGSLGGFQAQAFELHRAGIPLPSPGRLRLTGMPHDKVVDEVLAGRADVGFIRAGTLETMAGEGRVALDRLRILHRQDLPDFPYAVSTRLYPEWPVVALPHLDEDHARRIAAVLLALDAPLGRRDVGGVEGFSIPADYGAVEALLRDLRLPPYDGAPVFHASDVLRRYAAEIAALAAAFASIAALSIGVVVANRRLVRARHLAEEAAASRERALAELQEALASVRTLKGLLPICMYCHKIRTDQVSWDKLETYLGEHSEAQFTHSICPSCFAAQFPDETGRA